MESIKEFPRGILDQVISNSYVIKDSSDKLKRAPGPGLKLQATSYKASSFKRQASSPKQQASSFKPQATSSSILLPS
jgi:hypothetical protein